MQGAKIFKFVVSVCIASTLLGIPLFHLQLISPSRCWNYFEHITAGVWHKHGMSTIRLLALENELVCCQGHCLCVAINGCI